jgi:hypothetical protein
VKKPLEANNKNKKIKKYVKIVIQGESSGHTGMTNGAVRMFEKQAGITLGGNVNGQ